MGNILIRFTFVELICAIVVIALIIAVICAIFKEPSTKAVDATKQKSKSSSAPTVNVNVNTSTSADKSDNATK